MKEPKEFKYPRLYFTAHPNQYGGDLRIIYPNKIMAEIYSVFWHKWTATHYRDYHPTDVVQGLKTFCMMNGLECEYLGQLR